MKKLLIVLAVILYFGNTNAQNDRSWGVTAALQESTLDIMFPIWTGNRNVIAPSIGVYSVGGSGSDLGIGLRDRLYFREGTNIMPFISLGAAAIMAIPKEGDTVTDYLLGISGGGEYFFSDNFSVGVEAQLNFSFSNEDSDRFGNPGETNINTASLIFASIYF